MRWRDVVEEWQWFNRNRATLPGEQVAVAGLGAALLAGAWHSESRAATVLQAALGGVLLAHAASGREGAVRLLRPPRADVAMRHDARAFGLD